MSSFALNLKAKVDRILLYSLLRIRTTHSEKLTGVMKMNEIEALSRLMHTGPNFQNKSVMHVSIQIYRFFL